MSFRGMPGACRASRPSLGGFAVGGAVAEHFDVVVGGFDVGVLAADEILRGRVVDGGFEGFAVGGDGGVFSAFGFGKDGVRLVGGKGGLQVDPAAVDAAGDGAGCFGIGAEGEHTGLEFRGEFGALNGVAGEDEVQVGNLHIGGGGLETLFAVFEDFDEVVEGLQSGFDVGFHGMVFV